jgi:putative membrane protein
MSQRLYRSFQAFVLLALCLFFAAKLATGQVTYYINLRFTPLTIFAAIFLAILAVTLFNEIKQMRKKKHEDDHVDSDHDHAPASANLWFMVVPLAIGLFIPARPLDSSAFATKGFNTAGPLVSSNSTAKVIDTASEDRNILDWVKIFNYEKDLTPYLGQQAAVIGFVYRDEQLLNENQFYVSRFILSCCAADAFSIGMVANWPEAKTLKNDSWVLVKGPVSSLKMHDQTVLVVDATSVQSVPAPEQPYLYP